MGNELQALARTIAELQEKNDALEKQINTQLDISTKWYSEKMDAEDKVKELEKKVAGLKEQREKDLKRIEALEQVKTTEKSRVAEWMKKYDDLHKCYKAVQKDAQTEYQLRQKAEKALKELTPGGGASEKEKIRELHAKLTDTEADRDIAKNRCEELERNLDCVIGELDVAKNERDIAEKDIEELQNEVCDLRVKLEGVE